MEAANIKVVQDAYAAFGRGDMDALLACMTAQHDAVVALGHYRAVTRGTGRRFESAS